MSKEERGQVMANGKNMDIGRLPRLLRREGSDRKGQWILEI